KILLGLTALLIGSYVWGLRLITPTPSDCAWKLDLAPLPALPAAMPGGRAREIRYEAPGTMRQPEGVVMTGGGFTLVDMIPYAYQLVFPDRTIVIDTGMGDADAHKMHVSTFDDAAWQRIGRAMREASAIYVTHEHADHLGGVCALADSLDPSRVHLNAA